MLNNQHAHMEAATADVERLKELAMHSADHELGAQVLRTMFGLQQLMHPTSTPTPDGGYVVRVNAEEHALISGLIMPDGVNTLGIFSSAFRTLSDRFPPQAFQSWATDNPDLYEVDDIVTDMEG